MSCVCTSFSSVMNNITVRFWFLILWGARTAKDMFDFLLTLKWEKKPQCLLTILNQPTPLQNNNKEKSKQKKTKQKTKPKQLWTTFGQNFAIIIYFPPSHILEEISNPCLWSVLMTSDKNYRNAKQERLLLWWWKCLILLTMFIA